MSDGDPSDVLYHINVSKRAGLPRYMLTCGDPKRAQLIANEFLEDAKELAHNREYWSFVGTYKGVRLVVASHGIGSPSTAIGMEEFGMCGVDTIIRVGTSGSLQRHVHLGSVVNVTAAVRDEGTSAQYVDLRFPAVASVDVVLAIREGAKRLGVQCAEGLGHSKDSFYSEQPGFTPMEERTRERWKAWERAGVLATEMENSLLFVLGQLRGWRTGSVLAVIGSTWDEVPISADPKAGIKDAIKIGLEAIRILADADAKQSLNS